MRTRLGIHPTAILLILTAALPFSWLSCSILTTRPVQEMSDTSSAIRAAREVQADTLAPELFRDANEWWLKAKKEYKFKNFQLALDYSSKARRLAEQAEFEAIRNGGTRTEVDAPPDPFQRPEGGGTKYAPYAYPTPTGTPVEAYDQRKAEDDKAKAPSVTTPNPTSTAPSTTTGTPSTTGGTTAPSSK